MKIQLWQNLFGEMSSYEQHMKIQLWQNLFGEMSSIVNVSTTSAATT